MGNIILDSYHRFLDNKNRIDLELNEFLKNVEFDEYKVMNQYNVEIGFVLLNFKINTNLNYLKDISYLELMILRDLKEMFRIPLYLDFNLDFCILTYRKIVQNYFSFINISKFDFVYRYRY